MNKKQWLLAGIAAAIGSAVYFVVKKKNQSPGKPSKKAPQLNLNNPGEQSEFTTSASQSDIG